MATVIFIKESKQTPSAMRGCINYCVQDKKTVDSDGRQYVGGVNCLGTHANDEFMATKNLYGKASGIYFYQYVQSFMPGEIKSYDEVYRIGLEFAEKSFRAMRCWWQRTLMHTMTTAFSACTTILLSIRSALRMAERFTSRQTPCRSFVKSATIFVKSTGCRSFLPPSELTEKASAHGNTGQP